MIEFARREGFEVSSPVALDAGGDRIAAATGEDLYVLDATDRHRLGVNRPVDDVAIDRNVYVLSGEELIALTESGVELWSRTVEGAEEIAATHGNVAALTADDRIVSVDGNTSSTRFVHELEHPDLPAEGIFAAESGFLVAAWTYLTYVDLAGEVVYDVNLDGQIASVGTIGDSAVAALKDGTSRCLDGEGNQRWRRELSATRLTASGTEPLLAVGDRELRIVEENGDATPLELPVGSEVAATDQLGVVCIVGLDGAVEEFRRLDDGSNADRLDATIEDGDLTPRTAVSARISNAGPESITAKFRLRATGAELDETEFVRSLAPGERTVLESDVDRLTADRDVTLAVRVGDRSIAKRELPVAERPPEAAVDAEASLAAIESGSARIELSVHNGGRTPLGDLRTRPMDRRLAVPPEETEAVELSVSYAAGRRRTFEIVEGSHTGVVDEAAVELPETPLAASIEQGGDASNPYVEARLENRTALPITDAFRIDVGSGTRRVVRETTLPAESVETVVVFLAEPVREPFDVAVAADGLDLESVDRLPGWDPDIGSATGAAERSVPEVAQPERIGRDAPPATAGSEPVGASDGTVPVAVSRAVDDGAPIDRAIEEELVFRNRSGEPVSGATFTVREETVRLPDLAPEETARYKRNYVFREPGGVELPAGVLRCENGRRELPTRAVDVEETSLRVGATVRLGDATAEIAVVVDNGRASDAVIGEAALGIPSTEEQIQLSPADRGEEWRVPGGDRREFTADVPRDALIDVEDDVFGFGFVERVEGDRIVTLAETEAGGVPLAASLVDGEVVYDGYGQLAVRITNTADRPLTGLAVEAESAALDAFYEPETDIALEAGETLEHLVEVNPGTHSELRVELRVSFETETGTGTQRWTLSGPVAETAPEWDRSLLEAWTATPAAGGSGGDPLEGRLETDYYPG